MTYRLLVLAGSSLSISIVESLKIRSIVLVLSAVTSSKHIYRYNTRPLVLVILNPFLIYLNATLSTSNGLEGLTSMVLTVLIFSRSRTRKCMRTLGPLDLPP